jgi:membrane protein required for colicin V production
MQSYDIIMLVVLVGATIFGFWKGMAWQIASLASLVVSYVASLKFSEQLAPMFGQPPLNRFAAMAAIYVGTSFVIWTLFRLVSRVIDKVRLEAFDKQLGAIIGFAKGVLLCLVITFFAVSVPAGRATVIGSQSGHYIVALLDKAHAVVPPELHQIVDPYLNNLEQKLNPNYQPQAQDLQQLWQNQAQAAAQNMLPQVPWPQSQPAQTGQPQFAWPSGLPQPNEILQNSSTAWPTTPQERTAESGDPYSMPR